MLTGSVHVDPGAGWFPHFLGFADETGAATARSQPQRARSRRAPATRAGLAAVAASPTGPRARGAEALVVALGVDAAGGDPESPLDVTGARLPGGGPALGALGLPTVVVQEGGYDLDEIGRARARGARRESRRERMAEGSIWVGHDEHEGVLAQPRKDLKPPPHWRLEAVARHAAAALAHRRRRPAAARSSSRTARPRTSGCSTSRARRAASA